MDRSSATAAAGLLAGWLLARLALEAAPAGGRRAGANGADPCAAAPPSALRHPTGADDLSAAQLRALPGLGPARALQIARARWELDLRGGPESWESLPGIGPATVATIRSALAAARVEGSTSPAYTVGPPP